MENVQTLLQYLPPLGGIEIEHVLAWVTALMAALAVVGWLLDLALPRLRVQAAKTKSKLDDDVVHWLERVVVVLHLVNAIVPRPTFGQPNALRHGEGRKPTLEELEAILNSGDEAPYDILPNGHIRPKAPRPKAPPADFGPGAVLFAFVMAGSVLMQGCGGVSEWDVHAAAAQTSNETAVTGRGIIMAERRRVLLAAGLGAEDIATAVRAAAEVWDTDHRALVEAYNIFASTANSYAALAFAALKGEVDDLGRLVQAARHVADAWNAVVAILEATGVTDSVPRIPDWLLRFLEGDLTAQPTAGGAS